MSNPIPPNNETAGAWVPCLPESAPFTAEQRAYLNGFLAGLLSRAPVNNVNAPAPAPAAAPLVPVTILFGTQTGNAETLVPAIARNTILTAALDQGRYRADDVVGIVMGTDTVLLYVHKM